MTRKRVDFHFCKYREYTWFLYWHVVQIEIIISIKNYHSIHTNTKYANGLMFFKWLIITVILQIEAFKEQTKASNCESTVESTSKSSSNSSLANDDESSTTLALDAVVNVTVYCYNGAPMQLKEGEFVDVVFPATIVNHLPCFIRTWRIYHVNIMATTLPSLSKKLTVLTSYANFD